MKRKSSAGLSGVIAAILVTAVIVAGIAATNYVAATSSAQNRQLMEELRRQAFKNQELVRIYIHAENSSDIDSPPRITFVNAWGWPSNITKLLAVYRQDSQRQVIEINRQIIIPPGSRVTISPQDLGLSYASFRQLADNLAALIAYTDAGNSFGNTWGYPREDNLLGATTVTTYNTTTTEVWQVPSFTTINNTFYMNRTITLNPPAPITNSTIRAINHFEKINILARGVRTSWDPYIYYSASVTELPEDGSPSAPYPDWRNTINVRWEIPPIQCNWWGECYTSGWFYVLWAWEPAGWADASDNTKTVYVERGAYYTNINAPTSLIVSINIAPLGSTCTVAYSLRRVDVQPAPPNYPTPTATYMRQGEYVSMTHYPTRYIWSGAYWNPDLSMTVYWTKTTTYPAGPALTFNNYYRGTFTAALLYSGTRFVRPGDNPNQPVYMMVATRTAPVITAYGVRPYGVAWPAWQAVISALPTYTVGPENPVYVNHFQVTEDSYTVHRYYYVDKVECNIYTPAPSAPSGVYTGPTYTCPPDQSCVSSPPSTCDITAAIVTVPVASGGSSGGGGGGSSGGGGGSGAGFAVIVKYLVNCLPR